MAKLEAEGNHAGSIRVYRQATQLVAVMASAASITIAFCAAPLLWAWTGDKVLAHQAAPILVLYAVGNSILAIHAFPYYLQYAKGDLWLHLIGNAVFVVLLVPFIIWAASKYGGVGAGYVWLVMNMIAFVALPALVHRKFAPELNLKWYFQDVLTLFLVVVIAGYFLSTILPYSDSRGWQIGAVMAFGLLVLMAGACASTTVWDQAKYQFRHRLMKQEV